MATTAEQLIKALQELPPKTKVCVFDPEADQYLDFDIEAGFIVEFIEEDGTQQAMIEVTAVHEPYQ